MKKVISAVTAIASFYLFPNLLAADLAERHTIGFAVHAVYIIAVMAWTYFVRRLTKDEIKLAYKRAKKTDQKARFEERMRNL